MTDILEKLKSCIEQMINDKAHEKSEALASVLDEVLTAWRYEADQGDGIDERHVDIYENARQELCAFRGWGYAPYLPRKSS